MSRKRLERPRGRRQGSHSRRSAHGNVREAAGFVVERTLQARSPVSAFLGHARARCDPRDHALLNELVLGTLRWLRRLDHLIEASAKRPISKIEPALLTVLRVATYQLFFLDRIPDRAVVHEAVDHARRLTHKGGAPGFVNAVLRNLARDKDLRSWPVELEDPVQRLGVEWSHPDLLVGRWLERFGEARTQALLQANNRTKPLHLLAFADRGGRELLAERLIDEGVVVEPSDLAPLGIKVREGDPFSTASFRGGHFYTQDEASQLAALIPQPEAGERVLDVAGAPGGKTLSLLAWQPDLRCVLADVSMERLRLARENLSRLGLDVPLLVSDGRSGCVSARFDRVIADLPCSGTGTLRKHPELKWRVSEEELERLSKLGSEILHGAADAVAPSGKLVVITCSIEPEENEHVVERFLAEHAEFERAPLDEEAMVHLPESSRSSSDGLWRLLPEEEHDGFTVQVLTRRR